MGREGKVAEWRRSLELAACLPGGSGGGVALATAPCLTADAAASPAPPPLLASAPPLQVVEVVEERARDLRLCDLLAQYHNKGRTNRIIVFVLYKKEAVRVEQALQRKGFKVRAGAAGRGPGVRWGLCLDLRMCGHMGMHGERRGRCAGVAGILIDGGGGERRRWQSTATSASRSAPPRWTSSRAARCRCWSRPTSRRAGSTSPTSRCESGGGVCRV